ncbi:MAG: hypothetical protein AAB553_02260 [Patescibacteria group bacterium]
MKLTSLKKLTKTPRSLLLPSAIVFFAFLVLLQVVRPLQKTFVLAATTTTTVEDTTKGTGTNQFEYVGTWVRCGGCQPATSNASFHYNYTSGNKVVLRFTGNQAKVYAVKENLGGIVSVSIDGGTAVSVDTYAATKVAALVYTSPTLSSGNHTITITNTNQKNVASTGNVFSLDKVEVLETVGEPTPTVAPTVVPVPTVTPQPTATPTATPTPTAAPTAIPTVAPTATMTPTPTVIPTATPTTVPEQNAVVQLSTTVEDTVKGTGNNQFQYTGTWVNCGGCVTGGNNTTQYSYTQGNSVTFRFNGSQVKFYGVKEKPGGIISFKIDNGTPVNVDTYAATKTQGLIYTSPVLSAGDHTLTMTITSSKNSASTGYVFVVDKAEVYTVTATPTPTAPPLPTATPTTAPTAIPSISPTPAASVATLYGKAGTFGNLGTTLPSGQGVQTVGVDGWGFTSGQSEFFSALAPNGEIVLGTNPQTDNQAYATADHMAVGIFNSVENSFRNLIIPTSTGAQSVTNPFYTVGGASVDTLLPVSVDGQTRIAFISAVSYHGWDIAANGEYPTLGYLDVNNGELGYNSTLSKSANQINATGALGASTCPQSANIFGQQVGNCRGFAEMDLLPLSQKFVVSQYYPDTYAGEQSGRIVVMNTDGSIAASYAYPNISNGNGGYLTVNPREVIADPTSSGDLEYFTVIFDVADGSVQKEFPLQEFAYNRATNQITPISLPVLSGQTSTSGQQYRFETARYDDQGNLWATQALTNSLAGGSIVVYAKSDGVRTKLETICTVSENWNGELWGSTCAPDQTAANTGDYGQTRSFVQDPQTKTMFAATLSGYLLRVTQTGSGAGLTLNTLPAVNIGLDQLVDRSTHYVGVRKGVVDSANRALYLPVIQVANPADCPTWPGSAPCNPESLDQWLYKFDLTTLAQ